MNFLSVLVFLMTYLNHIPLLDASISTTLDDEKEGKINSSSFFEGFYLKLRRKFWEIIIDS